MQCDCLCRVKEKVKEHVAHQGVVNPRVHEQFLGIAMSTGEAVINLVYSVHGDNRPYNTQKGKPLNMVAKFCPFCGKPTMKPKEEKANAPT